MVNVPTPVPPYSTARSVDSERVFAVIPTASVEFAVMATLVPLDTRPPEFKNAFSVAIE